MRRASEGAARRKQLRVVEAAASGPTRWNLRRSCAFKLRRTLLRAGGCCAPEPALRSESWKLLRRAVEAARKQRRKPRRAAEAGAGVCFH